MKARIPVRTSDKIPMSYDGIKEVVEQEFARKQYELYSNAVQDITVQVMANVLRTLEVWYGWKDQRIRKFIHCMHGYEEDMVRYGISSTDNYNYFKEHFGIDLVDEFPAHVKQSKNGEPDDTFIHFTKENT